MIRTRMTIILLFVFALMAAMISHSSRVPDELLDEEEVVLRGPSLRISRVSGGDYNLIRVSKVWEGPPQEPFVNDGLTKAKAFQFQHRWKQFSFSTEITKVSSEFPRPGDPVRGIMLADVCISSKYIPCTFGRAYDTLGKITWMLNQLAEEGLNFWMMGGDNLYDEDGSISRKFFDRLSPQLLSVPLVAVPGNHDFWTSGSPSTEMKNQFGYGFAQYYMMDTEAARKSEDFPFNFPADVDSAHTIPSADNFFHYSAIGGAGFIAFSGGHEFDATLFDKACRYFSKNAPGEKATFVFLLSHWSTENMGCQVDMYTSRVHEIMSDPNGVLSKSCFPLVQSKRLYFVDGHFHDNRVLSEFGMRVAGQGMLDTGAFGFPLVQIVDEMVNQEQEKSLRESDITNEKLSRNLVVGSTTKRLIVSYVALAKDWYDPFVHARFEEVKRCAHERGGVFACLPHLHFVEVWINATATSP